MTNINYYALTTTNSPASDDLHSMPIYTIGTGTVASSGVIVTGTATLFTDEVAEGDFIISDVAKKAYEIIGVYTDTSLVLGETPSSAFAGESFKYVKKPLRLNKITIETPSGGSGTVNGVAVFVGQEIIDEREFGVTAPVVIDVDGGVINVETLQ